jgi:hypothetical protein
MERTWACRRLVLPLFFVLLAACFAPWDAQASGVRLDSAFGSGGVRFLPEEMLEDRGVGLLAAGRVAVSDGRELLTLLPSGRIDRHFGSAGYARYPTPGGSTGVDTFALGVDEQGRPVVAGHVELPGSTYTEPVGEAFVERFTPAGDPDLSFGDGAGYAVGGITLPSPEGGEMADAYYDGVAFDSAGRVVLSGGRKTGTEPTKNGPVSTYAPFLTRLDQSGSVDDSFADGGTYLGPERSWMAAPGNKLILRAVGPGGAESLLRLDEGGRPDPTFGDAGYVPYPPGFANAPPRVDPRGRIVLRRFLPRVGHSRAEGLKIVRLLPDGSIDRSFGKNGFDLLRIPGFDQSRIAFDEGGRIVLDVRLFMRGKNGSESEDLALMRLLQDGRVDRTVGKGGILPIPKSDRADVYPEGADSFVVRGDRAVIRAAYRVPHEPPRGIVALFDLGGRR